MAKRKGTGELFQQSARTVFLNTSRQCFDNMQARFKKKGLPELPFTKEAFRDHFLKALGGNVDGFSRCRYCLAFFGVKEIGVDHAIPLSRGGPLGLENLEYPCRPCNARKGSMTPTEYLALLEFLETLPFARIDVLKRLELSVQLAAGAAATRGVIGELRKGGQWSAAQAAIRARKDKR